MKIISRSPLWLTSQNYRHGQIDQICLTAFLGFSLSTPGALLELEKTFKAAMESLAPFSALGLTLDSGLVKAKGEFLAAATAYAPNGQQSPSLSVSFTVGPIKRDFLVMGPSFKSSTTGGAPLNFVSQSLDWTKCAFDSLINPYGIDGQTKKNESGKIFQSPLVYELEKNLRGQPLKPFLKPASPLP
ncbi:MAG: DUF2169 domain-containing protein, partial [Deltaproteobacteria bacterium]|nr:DUF2169 domain-containing protein [Deltaproteobacteria bacterium]